MAVEPFKYDAFISYNSTDRPWAKKLADELEARGLKFFYDRASLEVGEPWEEQLDSSLDVAQHLIVLWSQQASQSKYVEYERTYFHVKTPSVAPDAKKAPRRQIIILLEDPPPKVHSTLQMIPTLKEKGAYAKGIEHLDANVWREVVAQVENTLTSGNNFTRVLVAVLATTKKFLEGFDFNQKVKPLGQTLNDIITRMGIKDKAALLECYGEKRTDWCPFGDKANVWTVLDRIKKQVLAATKNSVNLQWELIADQFWSTESIPQLVAAQREARRLVSELSLIVIDPLSLCDDSVKDSINLIQECFVNNNSIIMVLTPYKMLEPNASLRDLLQGRAMPVFNLFYQPPVPPTSPFANFGIYIGDDLDMKRFILMTLGQYVGKSLAQPKNPFTNP